MRRIALAAAMTLSVMGAAFAQSSGSAGTSSDASGQGKGNIRQQVQASLKQSGFTDIKIMPESFLVRAKDPQGRPVMMVINPDSVTAVTDLSAAGSAARGNSSAGSTNGSGVTPAPQTNGNDAMMPSAKSGASGSTTSPASK